MAGRQEGFDFFLLRGIEFFIGFGNERLQLGLGAYGFYFLLFILKENGFYMPLVSLETDHKNDVLSDHL